jgi:glycosyltransferase involved in cell wall biosynthesis
MKICWQGFLQGTHSWGIVGQNLCRALIKMGHQVDMFATLGINNFPADLKSNLVGYVDNNQIIGNNLTENYDLQLSYTAMRNFQQYFSHGNKNRFAIWCYEWQYLPTGWAKYHNYVDKILAPSEWSREQFLLNKIPENKVVVIPHGIDPSTFNNKNKYLLKTKKNIVLLCNIGQAHIRKNIKGMFDAYHKAFTKNDNICLVAKIHRTPIKQQFEVDPIKIYNEVKREYKNQPEVELITEYIPDMVELYNACDIVYSLPFAECFYIPGLETIFADKINICPNYGGQLQYLNVNNAILVNGKMTRTILAEQYWSANPKNEHFESDINDAVDKLRYAYNNLDEVNKLKANYNSIREEYTWEKQALKIIDMCK